MKKFAVLLYPNFSLQEITCLTSALTVWFGETVDYLASANQAYQSEEGLRVFPTKTTAEVNITDYDCVILPGTIDPLPALFDDALIAFLRSGVDTSVVFAAISSAPALLSKAGILTDKKFTAGYFMQFADTFPFIQTEHFLHRPVVEHDNVITGIGLFFREFAETVLQKFGYPVGNDFMRYDPAAFSEEELTFFWSQAEYQEFLEELKHYPM